MLEYEKVTKNFSQDLKLEHIVESSYFDYAVPFLG